MPHALPAKLHAAPGRLMKYNRFSVSIGIILLMCPQVEEEADVAELVDTAALSSAADAAFMLAVLAATGIAAPHVPMNDSWAVKTLHAAAQGGSPEANLALAHRYFTADGVPGSCQEGLRLDIVCNGRTLPLPANQAVLLALQAQVE